MKKLLLLLMVASVGIAGTATAQKKSKKHHVENRGYSRDNDRYDRDRYDREDRYDRNTNNDKYSKNAPRKVMDAFNRDYPNASRVTWTKSRGVWTASFKRGFLSSNTVASYRANGERLRNGEYNNRTARANTSTKNNFWYRNR